MASLELLLQAVTNKNHASVIKKVLRLDKAEKVLCSVAFVHEAGVNVLKDELKAHGKTAKFFVGIRNDITSYQGLLRLLDLGVTVFAVDTGSRNTIFHPKLFLATAANKAKVIIGSANLTWGGLYNNIEAGVALSLDLTKAENKKFIDSTVAVLEGLPVSHPQHVFALKNKAAVEALFNEGRLADENVVRAPAVKSSVRKGERDTLVPMKLYWKQPPARKKVQPPAKPKAKSAAVVVVDEDAPPHVNAALPGVLIWESNPLKERDLNIPTGATTNSTGSMLWKKGAIKGIDQRHFFRDVAFAGLAWTKDASPKKAHYERAEASFEIIIKGINYGKYILRLSHNTDTKSRSYQQNNSMTQIHWGKAKSIIAKRDLLGRTMSLYRKETTPPEFLIEID
jgi:HKD family nuclease